jgi:hypothetical protein
MADSQWFVARILTLAIGGLLAAAGAAIGATAAVAMGRGVGKWAGVGAEVGLLASVVYLAFVSCYGIVGWRGRRRDRRLVAVEHRGNSSEPGSNVRLRK